MATASSIAMRVSNAARHVHTSGVFALQLHANRVESCCITTGMMGGGRHSVTESFLQDFTSEVRTVVGSSLFASILGKRNVNGGDLVEDDGVTQNTFFAIEASSAVATTSSSAASSSSATYVTFRLRVKDSRISAALYAAITKHSFIVLSECRLMLLSAATTSTTATTTTTATAAAVAAKTTPEQLNMDEELFSAIERVVGGGGGSSSQTLSSAHLLFSQLREQRRQLQQQPHHHVDMIDVPRLLDEHKEFIASINAAAVYSEPGSGLASPFACLLWCLFAMPVTHDELSTILATHQNRYLRAAAMYYARYLCPLEHLAPVFAPSMEDETVIACAGDMSETRSMKDLARKLLLEDEVDEAWLPTYSKWWIKTVIEPTIRLMADHKLMAERAAAMRGGVRVSSTVGKRHRDEADDEARREGDPHAAGNKRSHSGGGGGKTTLMGFRSALELALFVDQARMLATGDVLQQMLMAAKDQRDAAATADDDDDEEAMWAKKHGAAAGSAVPAVAATPQHLQQTMTDGGVGGPQAAAAGQNRQQSSAPVAVAVVDIRKLAASRAQKAIVELLGPQGACRALRKSDPAYLRI
jgi:hypothetical protein